MIVAPMIMPRVASPSRMYPAPGSNHPAMAASAGGTFRLRRESVVLMGRESVRGK